MHRTLLVAAFLAACSSGEPPTASPDGNRPADATADRSNDSPDTGGADGGLDATADTSSDAVTACRSNSDCAGAGVCDTPTGRCVQCLTGANCPAATPVCQANRCVAATACTSSRMCPNQVCDTAVGRCVDCVADTDCTGGTVCRSNGCVAPPPRCTSSRECSARMQVCDTAAGACVDCVVDADCAMGQRCTAERACVASACSPGAQECGAMGQLRVCSAAGAWEERACGAGMACVGGMCRAAVCTPGEYSCTSAESASLCNPDGQGSSMAACPARPHAAPACVARRCALACETGWGDCDGNLTNGCETDLSSSAMHCGVCGNVCPASPCAMGRCGAAMCAAGTGDCDGSPANGCETMLLENVRNCGACGRVCPAGPSGALAACRAGACTTACDFGRLDCDGDSSNGCEVMGQSDANHCGACGRACPSGRRCVMGACAYSVPVRMGTPRRTHALAWGNDDRVYAIGGHTTGGAVTAVVEAYDGATGTWSVRAPLPTARAALAAITLRDGRVLAIGGTPSAVGVNVVEAYTPAANAWAAIAPMPTARTSMAVARGNDGRAYVFGGAAALGGFASTVAEVYDPASNSWATLRPMPRARSDASAVTLPDGRIYLFGGRNLVFVDAVDVYDPATNSWAAGPTPPAFSYFTATRGSDNRVYFIQGDGPRQCNALTLPATYTRLASLNATRGAAYAVTAMNGAIMVTGGTGSAGEILATCELYSIATDVWQGGIF